jgi:molecular chaperone DnaJ
MVQDNLYSILGVERSATDDEVKRAFRARALEIHPDKQTCPKQKEGAEKIFKELNHAYHVLSDPQRRAAYDSGKPLGGEAATEFGDIFKQMFSSATGGMSFVVVDEDLQDIIGSTFNLSEGAKQTSKRIVSVSVNITIKDVCRGAKKKIAFSTVAKCLHCNGFGVNDPKYDVINCMVCGGCGTTVNNLFGGLQVSMTCMSCGGRGNMRRNGCKPCKGCGGAGETETQRHATVTIHPGCQNAHVIHTEEHGETVYEFKTVYHLEPHTRIKGTDVHIHVPITLVELIGGFNKVVCVGGVRRSLISKCYFNPHKSKKISQGGLPGSKHAIRGDLYIHWRVIMPDHKSGDAVTLKTFAQVFQTGATTKSTCTLENDTAK